MGVSATGKWREYERYVAAIESESQSTTEVSATLNARILGRVSGVKRQIDCLIDERFKDGFQRRILVEAKLYKRPLNVKDIEGFIGMMA